MSAERTYEAKVKRADGWALLVCISAILAGSALLASEASVFRDMKSLLALILLYGGMGIAASIAARMILSGR